MASEHTATLKSEKVLESIRRAQRSKEVVDVDQEMVKIVIFEACGARYGFYGSDIREILQQSQISWVPGLPEYLPGLINVRGDIESVVDLHYFLGGGGAAAEKSVVAMVVRDDFRSGVLVDAIVDVLDILASEIRPPLATLQGAARELVCGEFDHQGRLVTLLDAEKLAAKIRL